MWDRRGIPSNSFVCESSIYIPPNGSSTPFDLISMKVLRCIESQVDKHWRTPIAILHPRSLGSGIVVDVYEHLGGVPPKKLDINFLPGRITMQEYPCYQSRYVGRPHFGHKAAVEVMLSTTY